MMRKNSIFIVFLMLLTFTFSCKKNQKSNITNTEVNENFYTPNWESLSKHNQEPEWLQDAKFGIYFHWGPYSVPAYFSEWYPSKMYIKDSPVYKYHKETYGSQETFGYHDFIPQFKAEHFNAEEWVSLFKKAGAKFAGPVAEHHDGFAMWDSKVNPWNSVKKGPKRDITGEIAKAVRKNNMKLITTFHHARTLQRYADTPEKWGGHNSHYTYNPKYHTSTTNPELSILYGNIPVEKFNTLWKDQVNEVVNQYQPDAIWFDVWLDFIPEKTRQEMCADYFNTASKNNQEVFIGYKHLDLPKEVGILDIENGGKKDISESTWMTDMTLSHKSWSYVEGQTYKDAGLIITNLIDIVSKNGIVLLNVSPKADGTIPGKQRKILGDIGDWLSKYGEAIYNTRPWYIYGFGNAKADEWHLGGQSSSVEYTANDIRFTQSKDKKSVYLFFLGKPKAGEDVYFPLLAHQRYCPKNIKRIVVLGTNIEVNYELKGPDGLKLTIPEAPMSDMATVFKFELE